MYLYNYIAKIHKNFQIHKKLIKIIIDLELRPKSSDIILGESDIAIFSDSRTDDATICDSAKQCTALILREWYKATTI